MSAPLFSVVTPNFNSGPKLDATVASVLGQEAGLYEYLVIDGGSTDGGVDRLRAYGAALRWVSERDAGIYDAMNKGVRMSAGRFLYFLGAGDCLQPGVLRAVADSVPSAAGPLRLLYGDVFWREGGGRYGGVFDANRIVYQNICHQAIFYERGIFDLLGGYDLRYPTCADYALNTRCFGRPEIRATHLDLLIADYEGEGASSTPDRAFRADHFALLWRCLGPGAALRNVYHFSEHLGWARRLRFHLQHPWQVPGRFWRRLRRRAAGPR